ncbi:MAG: TIGR00725 family protein [Candidatus Eisenbacteria bacterium]|uniref:TIGR00725 family protein n=1 Tax=Eiseniibacteriota bacterium TaxID=2212470 RepID=A0A948RXD0_UNCEI|nr:TIGR00725 family protein [Candidatus Eisenbacteria bacterium]MBU1950260.1 TIGR00725 family protein [Candidatus Eisenbacteria bacterium]MBU2689974.1 TIGR00725 family protein [Candidatus Eisenbacteria bacterium]
MGGSTCSKELYNDTRLMAGKLAARGVVILCGGGSGIMEAAARGASESGGLTLGILPGSSAGQTPPNRWIQIPIYTGLSDARNAVNVRSSQAILAVGGSYGTLSEIALALKIGKPVVTYKTWDLPPPPTGDRGPLHAAGNPDEAVRLLLDLVEME